MADAASSRLGAEWLAARRRADDARKRPDPRARRRFPRRAPRAALAAGREDVRLRRPGTGRSRSRISSPGAASSLVYHFIYPVHWDGLRARAARSGRTATTARCRTSPARDVTLVAVSISPLRLGSRRSEGAWAGASSGCRRGGSDFNRDFGVSFTPDEIASKARLFITSGPSPSRSSEAPGVSVFARGRRTTSSSATPASRAGSIPSILPISCWTSYPRAGTRRACPIPWSGSGTATRTRNRELLRKPCARQGPTTRIPASQPVALRGSG